jgi:hypothetical protein
LQLIAADLTRAHRGNPLLHRLVHRPDDEPRAELLGATIPELEQFRKLMAGFHIQKWHRDI